MIRIALTSVPPRFGTLGARIEELLAQRPDAVSLTLPHRYDRFPEWDGDVPKLPEGVDLVRAQDKGPATKFCTVFAAHPGEDILLADDDCIYSPGWLATFRSARALHPGAAIAASTFDTGRLGLAAGHSIAQGYAGVLICPSWLDESVLRPDGNSRWVDDIWVSAHCAAARIPISPCPEARALVRPLESAEPLQNALIDGLDRGRLNKSVAQDLANRFEIWSSS